MHVVLHAWLPFRFVTFLEELRDRLSELASQRGQSLQAYLFDVLSDEARRQDNLAVLGRRERYIQHPAQLG